MMPNYGRYMTQTATFLENRDNIRLPPLIWHQSIFHGFPMDLLTVHCCHHYWKTVALFTFLADLAT